VIDYEIALTCAVRFGPVVDPIDRGDVDMELNITPLREPTPALLDRHYRAILDALPHAVAVLRPRDLLVVYANLRFAAIAGRPFNRPMPLVAAMPAGAGSIVGQVAAIRAQLDAGSEASFETPRPSDDGRERSIRYTITRLPRADLDELWLLAGHDLTAARASDARLCRSQQRFDALWSSGMVGFVISDAGGFLVEANDTYLAMIGYDRSVLAARSLHCSALTPPDHDSLDLRAAKQLNPRGGAEPWESEIVRADGARVPVMCGVVTTDDGHHVCIVTDLSMRKRAELALLRTEEQLRQAQKMESIGRLAGGIAHDFNNLLSIIIGYPGMLLDELDADHPMRSDLEEIAKAGHRAAELTHQLLLFSRQRVVEPRVLDLNALLNGMDRMVSRLIGEDLDLVVSAKAELGHVMADPGNLEQVVLNLVVNARDAMPVGGKLTIDTSNLTIDADDAARYAGFSPGHYVVLAVSDTGCGMDAATQARIFEPFFTTKGIGQGTGLGLSTVFGIVAQSGGHVWVYSELGRGTTFKIYLPRIDDELASAPKLAPIATLRGTETVLLVEDEPQVRTVAHSILRHLGYTVVEARTPADAERLMEEHGDRIDVLLTDVVMPQMSGPELARRLQRTRPELRVLCMSGYTDDSVVRHGALDQGTAFLQKPLTQETVARKLRELLDGRYPAAGSR